MATSSSIFSTPVGSEKADTIVVAASVRLTVEELIEKYLAENVIGPRIPMITDAFMIVKKSSGIPMDLVLLIVTSQREKKETVERKNQGATKVRRAHIPAYPTNESKDTQAKTGNTPKTGRSSGICKSGLSGKDETNKPESRTRSLPSEWRQTTRPGAW
ncbi:Hypothetical protein CINCED_3A005343 [Cinara cedri]|uniref:Uncharacterized protein n=1 Tax=Cinara cedri TaxID=506608 RepID=A0A5E4M0N3_9HEMI|nr:Hypothetical protein CINCED_3A005343 [Cinara cedri]